MHVPVVAADGSADLEHLRRGGTNFKCSIRFRNDLPEVGMLMLGAYRAVNAQH